MQKTALRYTAIIVCLALLVCLAIWARGRQSGSGQINAYSAVFHNDKAAVRAFLDAGGDVNQHSSNGYSLLRYAAIAGKVDMVKFLLSKGADPNLPDILGHPPIYGAMFKSSLNLAKVFLDNGANLHFRNEHGATLLHIACAERTDRTGIIGLLAERGLDVNVRDNDGNTPLLAAVSTDNIPAATVLLKLGADVRAANKKGESALHIAARNDSPRLAGLLISRGAAVDALDRDRKTPLHYAAAGPDMGDDSDPSGVGVAKLLIANGADVNARDKDGHTPMLLAQDNAEFENWRVGNLLKKHGGHK